jgi:HAMP domain-containing protein
VRFNSLKAKLTCLIVGCMVISVLLIASLLVLDYQRHERLLAWQNLHNASNVFANLENDCIRTLSATLTALLYDEKIKTIYLEKNRLKLYRFTAPLFKNLKAKFGITHWLFIYPETAPAGLAGRCFLRVHDASLFGDDLNRSTFKQAVGTKTFASGKELGKTAFALRVVHPYYQGQKLIGYMELGQEIDAFLAGMKRETGDDFAFLIQKKYLNKESWSLVRKTKGLRQNWEDMPQSVLINGLVPDERISRFAGDLETIPDDGAILGTERAGKSLFLKGIFPVRDAEQRKVGGILVLHDITAWNRSLQRTLVQTILCLLLLTILLTCLILLMLDRLVIRRLSKMKQVVTVVAGGNYTAEIVPSADDEIGQFEIIFEQFRKMFVTTISEIGKGPGGKEP